MFGDLGHVSLGCRYLQELADKGPSYDSSNLVGLRGLYWQGLGRVGREVQGIKYLC